MLKIIVLFSLLMSALVADKVVVKTAVVNMYANPNKSIDDIKSMALKQAKLDALSEIFGDFVKSEAIVSNGKLIDSLISESSSIGVIHLKDTPQYANGENFGDIVVTITAYATDKDIQKFTPQQIELKNFKYKNNNIPLKKLKSAAENAFIIQALSQVEPKIKNASAYTLKKAKNLTTSLDIKSENMKFDTETMSYNISGTVGYVPFLLDQEIN